MKFLRLTIWLMQRYLKMYRVCALSGCLLMIEIVFCAVTPKLYVCMHFEKKAYNIPDKKEKTQQILLKMCFTVVHSIVWFYICFVTTTNLNYTNVEIQMKTRNRFKKTLIE